MSVASMNDYSQGVVSVPSSSSSASSSLPCESDQKYLRLNNALNQYSCDSTALMKKCMISAGFSQDDARECDETYLMFFERALEKETMKLEMAKSRFHSLMGERSRNPLPTANPAGVHYSAGLNINLNGNVQGFPTTGNVPFAISSGSINTLDSASLHQMQRMTMGPTPSSQQVTSYGFHNFETPCEANVVQSNPIINGANSEWHSNRSIDTQSNSNLSNLSDLNPLMVDLSSDTGFGRIEHTSGPKVLDLTHVNIDGDEWKAVLQKTELTGFEF